MEIGIRIILTIMLLLLPFKALGADRRAQEQMIEPGFYILVSFSMNDQSLRKYFIEAESLGGKLIVKGLPGDKNSRNRFQAAKERVERARINVDINPVIFEELAIEHVPAMVVVRKDGVIKKVSGHISVSYALEAMEEKVELEVGRGVVR